MKSPCFDSSVVRVASAYAADEQPMEVELMLEKRNGRVLQEL